MNNDGDDEENDNEDEDGRDDMINKCEHYIDLYFSSLVGRGVIVSCKKYTSDVEVYWETVSRDGNDFFVRLDYGDGSFSIIRKAGEERSKLVRQLTAYMYEVMGNGTPFSPDAYPLPS